MRPSSSECRGSVEAVLRLSGRYQVLKHEQALTRPSVRAMGRQGRLGGMFQRTAAHDILRVCDSAQDSPACCPAGPGVFVSMRHAFFLLKAQRPKSPCLLMHSVIIKPLLCARPGKYLWSRQMAFLPFRSSLVGNMSNKQINKVAASSMKQIKLHTSMKQVYGEGLCGTGGQGKCQGSI